MLILAISFLIGMSQLLWLPSIQLDWLLVAAVLIILSILIKNRYHNLFLIIIGLCLGFSYAIITAYTAKTQQLQFIPDNAIEVSGRITNLPIVTAMGARGNKTKFAFEVINIAENLPLNKILVSWYNTDEEIKVGQTWKLKLKLKPIHGFKNLGTFDYSKWLFRQGYDATATVKSATKISHKKSNNIGINIDLQRANIAELINSKFSSTRVIGLVRALTIGDKSQISFQDSQLFQDTGTSHLIAISGLHIGLIAFIGILFGRLVFFVFANEKINRFKYEAIFAISFALFYALLAGMSIPTIRALVMVVVFSIAYAFKLNVSRWQAWSMAMLVVLLIDPFSVLDVGFWFSFGAVAVLMFAFTGRKTNHSKIYAFVKAQFVILIGLMPLMAIVFQQINLLTPIANLLVLPLASILLIPFIFVALIVYLVSESLSDFLFVIVEKLAEYFFLILDYLQQFNFLTVPINNINLITIIALLATTIILLLPKIFRWRILALFLLVPVFIKSESKIKLGEFQVNVLDVGQGLSVVVKTQNHSLIYDTGAKYESGFSMAASVVIPYLQNQGISKIDTLILSHRDNDHAGGINEIIYYFKEIKVLDVVGEYAACQYPNSWEWNKVKFEVLSPFELFPYLSNNSSCVIKITGNNGSILLTGDIEEPVEYRLIKNLSASIQSDVLLVPHHGSRTSSSIEFIKTVNPKIAINSSGFANQFNHPHPLIKQLYLDNDIEFLDTQEKGMIKLFFSHQGISIQQYSDIHPHFWDVATQIY